MELIEVHAAYRDGKARHFVPYLVREDSIMITLQVLRPRDDGNGEHWNAETLTGAGLGEAYRERFEHRDGSTYLRW